MSIYIRRFALFLFVAWYVPALAAEQYTFVYDTYQASTEKSSQSFQSWLVYHSNRGKFDSAFYQCMSALEQWWLPQSEQHMAGCNAYPYGDIRKTQCASGNISGSLLVWSQDLRAALSGTPWIKTFTGRNSAAGREACKFMPGLCEQIIGGIKSLNPTMVRPRMVCTKK